MTGLVSTMITGSLGGSEVHVQLPSAHLDGVDTPRRPSSARKAPRPIPIRPAACPELNLPVSNNLAVGDRNSGQGVWRQYV
jgi:hypothetical protein